MNAKKPKVRLMMNHELAMVDGLDGEVANGDRFITNKIRMIRGVQVILDRDVAELYGVETRVLNQAVKRNIKRFPRDFMFQLTRTIV